MNAFGETREIWIECTNLAYSAIASFTHVISQAMLLLHAIQARKEHHLFVLGSIGEPVTNCN